jgi:hypothetical protein
VPPTNFPDKARSGGSIYSNDILTYSNDILTLRFATPRNVAMEYSGRRCAVKMKLEV